jgi:hypothetical protein
MHPNNAYICDTCDTGVRLRTATVSDDFKALHYTHYSDFGHRHRTHTTTLYEGQGCDWDLVGRSLYNSIAGRCHMYHNNRHNVSQ